MEDKHKMRLTLNPDWTYPKNSWIAQNEEKKEAESGASNKFRGESVPVVASWKVVCLPGDERYPRTKPNTTAITGP